MAFINANLPESLKIRTLDNQVMEVTGKLINESTVLTNAFEMHEDPDVGEIIVPVESAALMNALEFMEYFDLDKPHYPDFDRQAFFEANQPALKFLASLSDEAHARMTHVIDYLECGRLIDCVMVFILNYVENLPHYKIRSQFFGDCRSYDDCASSGCPEAEPTNVAEYCSVVKEDFWETN